MKICVRCGIEKPLEDFHNCSTARDKHRNRCKACSKTTLAQEITALMDLWNKKGLPEGSPELE